ncbi:MAG: DUF4835 family protein [Flammeovirgaceae bacterium]|nr:DUF4835 family protein [Flammeovirgaceae bacterium]
MHRLIILFVFISSNTLAQELFCVVRVNAEQISTSDRGIFTDMERSFANFLNTRKWTGDTFKNHEKIQCNVLVTITKMPSIGNFAANVQITSARPVFNSNYESVLLNFADRDWEFEYIESLPLEYNDNTYLTNLTSMLAFYAYIIIGLDYDSYSDLGGNPYFQKALVVATNAQPANRPGWQSFGNNRSRYALIQDIINPQLVDLRHNTYNYHRLALDNFNSKPDESREIVLGVIKSIQRAWAVFPTSVLIVTFFDSKSGEIANIFSKGDLTTRREAYDILTNIDPKRTVYQNIISN